MDLYSEKENQDSRPGFKKKKSKVMKLSKFYDIGNKILFLRF